MPTATHTRSAPKSLDVTDVAQRFRSSLMRLARILRQDDSDDLSPTLASILFTVAREGPLTPGDIARRERIKKPSVTAAVDKLEQMGFVQRRRDASDGRVAWVALTDAGRRRVHARRANRTAWLASRFVDLDAKDLATLARASEIVDGLMEQGSDRA
ncbi:MAG: MarR family winged helix-turn-helix transcriptional regulator [Actinomycetota bacterium]